METLARLRLEGDSRGLVQGADQGYDALGRLTRQAGAATGATNQLTSAYSRAATQLTRIAAFAGLTFGVQSLIRYADSWKSLEGQLKLVTKSSSELALVQDKLFRMAQNTRQTYEATVSVYARMGRSAGDLGLSTEKMIRVTELINKTLIISGTSAAGASGALMQLGQALGQGALRGDELISVMEGMPELAMQVAEGMGIPWAKFRQTAAEGKITSQNIIQGLLKQADEIDQKFNKVPERVSDAMTKVRNSFLKLVGEADKGLGATAVLAKGLTLVANNMEKLAAAAVQIGILMGARWLSGPAKSLEMFVKNSLTAVAVSRDHSKALLEDTLRTKEKAIADERAAQAQIKKLTAMRASIVAAREEALAQQASAGAVLSQAAKVPIAGLSPLGGAAVAREMERRAVATATATAATRQLQQATLALESVDYKLEVAQAAVAGGMTRSAAATAQASVMMQGMSIASRAAAASMGFLGKALEFLKANWIILAITAIVEGLLWWSRRNEEARRKVQELADAQKEQIKVMKEATDVMLEQGRALLDETKKYDALTAAAKSGKAALDAEKKKQDVLEKGGQIWDNYVKKNASAEGATLKFNEAVAKGIPLALALQKEAEKTVTAKNKAAKAEENLSKAIEQGKEAQENAREALIQNAEAAGALVRALEVEKQRREAIKGGAAALDKFNQSQEKSAFILQQTNNLTGQAAKAAKAYAEELWRMKQANEALAAIQPAKVIKANVPGGASFSTAYRQETEMLRMESEAALKGARALEELTRQKELTIIASQLMADADRRGLTITAEAAYEQAAKLQQERAELIKTAQARQADAEKSKQIMENLFRGMQSSFSSFFQDVFENGVKSFRSLFASIKRMFFNLISEMAAAKLTQKMASMVGIGVGSNGQLDFSSVKGLMGKSLGSTGISVGQGLGAAGAGAGLGYGIGYASGNKTTGVLGGAAAGAAMGAMIGGPWGAAIGGVVGGVAGWFGAAKKAKEAAKAMEEARKQFEPALDAFRRLATGTLNELADSLRANNEQKDALLKQANEAYKGSKNEWMRNQKRGEIEKLAEQNAARLKQEFIDGITSQLNDAKGLGGANSIQQILKKRDQNAASLTTAGGDVSKAFELAQAQFNQFALSLTESQFQKALSGLPENLRYAAEEMWRLSEASRNAGELLTEEGKRLMADLDLREKLLAGKDREAKLLGFLQQEEAALAAARKEGMTDQALSRLSKVMRDEFVESMQAMERSALQSVAINNLRSKGLDDEADMVELVWRQEAELADYRKQGLDETTLAAVEAMQAEQRLAAERSRVAKITEARNSFAENYYQKVADVSGDPAAKRRALETQLTNNMQRELDAAQKLVDQGYITEEHYKRLATLLRDDMVRALEMLEKQVAHAAKSFSEDQELRRLAVLERVGGQDVSARRRQIEKDREVREAELGGKTQKQVRQIVYSQEIEDLATAFEKETSVMAKAITDSANEQLAALDKQLETAKAQLQVQQTQANELRKQAQAAREQATTLRAFAKQLRGVGASPELGLELSKKAYEDALAKGDAGDIQSTGSAYIEAARDYFGSTSEFQNILKKVTEDVETRATSFETLADNLESQAAAMYAAAEATEKLITKLEGDKDAVMKATQALLDNLKTSREAEFALRLKELEAQQALREQLAEKSDKPPTDMSDLPPWPPFPEVKIPPITIPPITFPSLAKDLEPVEQGLDRVATVSTAAGQTVSASVQEVKSEIQALQSQIGLLAAAIQSSQTTSRKA